MPKRATPHGDGPSLSEALAFASRSATVWSSQLGEIVRSVILHGSLALGDYIPGRSDIDLLMIVDRSLEEEELKQLSRAATVENACAPCHADLRVVTAAATATPTAVPPMEIYVQLDPRSRPTLEGRGQRERDLVVELSICREHGRSLRGAAPRELIADVPHEWVVNVGDQQLADWQSLTDDAKHAELMVLTACRIWRFQEEHIHCTKTAAGAWALARDPSLQSVRDALKRRNGDPKVSIEPDEIARLLATVRALLAAKRSTRRPPAHGVPRRSLQAGTSTLTARSRQSRNNTSTASRPDMATMKAPLTSCEPQCDQRPARRKRAK